LSNAPVSKFGPTNNLLLQVGAATLGRFIINTSRRFVYPFAPAISRGLGVPLPAVTSLIALNQATGLLSPVFGPFSDRWGYRNMMLLALGLLGAGMVSAGLWPLYAVLALGVFLGGLAKGIFDPALQAYIGQHATYERRGLFIGLMEMSWAGAALVGIPLAGLLIEHVGWQAPFLVLGLLALAALVLVRLVIPKDSRVDAAAGGGGFRQAWRVLRGSPVAWSVLAYAFLMSLANDAVFLVYGAWLETDFGLGLVALGSATTVIGVAELAGETLTATVADRLGKDRAVVLGLGLTIVGYALLPVIGQTLPLALVALFISFITYEFTVVTGFSLFTEVLPDARGTMMSAVLATSSLGRMLGALLAGPLWLWGGMMLVGPVAALVTALGMVCLLWGLRRW
jgi:predicted MFS family arabinose efflux permease